jgi:glutamate-1-semialdehyde 2,1-aminomutase
MYAERSQQYFKRAREVMPGGVNSPVRAFGSVGMEPLFIESGSGCRIKDADGNEFIDFVGSWGPLILGHAHDEVVSAVRQAAEKGTSFGAPTELEVRLAEKIVQMVPSVEMVRLVNSGTEATMSAARLARGFTGRERIVKFEGCYHGHGDGFLIKAGSGALTLGEPSSPGVPGGAAADTLTASYNDIDSVQQLFAEHGDQIAAVIVEPVAGNMGVIPAETEFLTGLRDLCNQHGSVLIFDEVMTGFRVHAGGAQALYSVMPDLTTMGKVIGGGMPVGAYGGRKDIMERVAPSGPVYQAGTLSGNPLSVAAGLKTLEIISRRSFFDELHQKANEFFNGITAFIDEHNLPLTVNHVNSMGCLFFKAGSVKNFADAMQADTDVFARYFALLLEAGIYIAPSQYEALFISAVHSPEDLSEASRKMGEALLSLDL